MTLIPAEKGDAARTLSLSIFDILYWAEVPDGEARSEDWLDACRAAISRNIDTALRAFDGDEISLAKLRKLKSKAFSLVGLMFSVQSLATLPVNEWPVQAQRQQFDDVATLAREFETIADDYDRARMMDSAAKVLSEPERPDTQPAEDLGTMVGERSPRSEPRLLDPRPIEEQETGPFDGRYACELSPDEQLRFCKTWETYVATHDYEACFGDNTFWDLNHGVIDILQSLNLPFECVLYLNYPSPHCFETLPDAQREVGRAVVHLRGIRNLAAKSRIKPLTKSNVDNADEGPLRKTATEIEKLAMPLSESELMILGTLHAAVTKWFSFDDLGATDEAGRAAIEVLRVAKLVETGHDLPLFDAPDCYAKHKPDGTLAWIFPDGTEKPSKVERVTLIPHARITLNGITAFRTAAVEDEDDGDTPGTPPVAELEFSTDNDEETAVLNLARELSGSNLQVPDEKVRTWLQWWWREQKFESSMPLANAPQRIIAGVIRDTLKGHRVAIHFARNLDDDGELMDAMPFVGRTNPSAPVKAIE